ncbi:hypothetical protein Xen7305DRAFT_00028450 [Xenococcus sp. PCC 7305]|uniref:hypothetical protein n=1 Tax=Xenococcus sp. PCC 7305 TaxID=102125 RepID=UPI0002AC672C|nr:hypothetical protein [Xenococcus sp. PCC 7305]ELS03125.1 hypothetical protein Xen7305DRAFT_00028450 [Xenococcus sp. PCC 7305]
MINNPFVLYSMIASLLFCIWLGLFLLDSTTPKTDKISWLVLLIAPLFWPIVLPLAIWELIHKSKVSYQFHLIEPNAFPIK